MRAREPYVSIVWGQPSSRHSACDYLNDQMYSVRGTNLYTALIVEEATTMTYQIDISSSIMTVLLMLACVLSGSQDNVSLLTSLSQPACTWIQMSTFGRKSLSLLDSTIFKEQNVLTLGDSSSSGYFTVKTLTYNI